MRPALALTVVAAVLAAAAPAAARIAVQHGIAGAEPLRAVHAAGDAASLNGDNRQPVGLHDLRHSYVALALARHANAKVTAQVYAGITEHGREAAAAKLVDAGFGA